MNMKAISKTKNDYCVRCGSHSIETVEKKMQFNMPNPGLIAVVQKCNECQECGETYFDDNQIAELSKKLKSEKSKIEKQ